MTLFTANGLLLGKTRGMTRGIMGSYPSYIALCYRDWLNTQYKKYPLDEIYSYTWLINVPELFSRRAPGNTCLTAIEKGANGTIDEPINNSKGCGGVMRVAPIGLYFETGNLTIDEIDMKEALCRQFANRKRLSEQIDLINKAIALSKEKMDDLEAIRELGQGCVGEETLAIAVYCSLKYSDDFDKALIASVSHSGDSDSIGAVTGNILGAYLGLKGIPQKYSDNLELKEVILEIADDLYNDCRISEYASYHDEVWEQKYIYNTYKPVRKKF